MFRHKDVWVEEHNSFIIEIVLWTCESPDTDRGPFRWNVYAYVLKNHKNFNKILKIYKEMPFHGSVTYHQFHRDDDCNITCIQVGCDYNHHYDSYYTFQDKLENVPQLLKNVEELVKWLKDHE